MKEQVHYKCNGKAAVSRFEIIGGTTNFCGPNNTSESCKTQFARSGECNSVSDNRGEQATSQAQKYAQWKRMEFERVLELLKEKVEERNANTGNLPQLVFRGTSIVELGHYSLHLEFDPVFHRPDDFVLTVKVGSDNRSYIAFSGSVRETHTGAQSVQSPQQRRVDQ
jgi:hypothetical protein